MKLPKLKRFWSSLTGLKQLNTRKTGLLLLILIFASLINVGCITLPEPWPATVGAFVTVFLLPGFLLSGLIFQKEELSWAERLPVAFVLAVGTLSLPAVLLLLLHSNLTILAWIATGLSWGLGGLYIWIDGSKSTEPKAIAGSQETASKSKEALNLMLLGAVLLAAAGAIYLFWITASTWSFGDNWTYLLYIRHYLDRPLTATVNPRPLNDNLANAFSPRALFNGWWVLQALMYRTAGFEPVDIYSFYFPPVLLIISLLAFYSLARELFQNRNAALLALLVQILYCLSSINSHDWIGRGFFDRIIEDKFLIWLIILPVTQFLTLKFVRTGYKRQLLALALGIMALALTHPMGLVQGGLSLGSFVFLYLLFSPRRSKIIKQAAMFSPLLLLLLIPLLQRQMLAGGNLAFGYAGGSDIQFILSRTRLWVLSAVDNSYMAHPQLIAHPLTILAILLFPLLIRYLRRSIAAQFLFSNMAVTLLLLYNPVTAPLLGRLITPWMLWRVSWLLPVSLTIGFFLHKMLDWVRHYLVKHKVSSQGVRRWQQFMPLLIIILLALTLQGYIFDSLNPLWERKYNTLTDSQRTILTALRQHITPGSIIMADLDFNTYIPAFASSARVLTFRFSSLPAAVADVERFYHTTMINTSTLELLKRRNVRYVIIENHHDLAIQFNSLPSLFIRRYQNSQYGLYEVQSYDPNHTITGNTAYLGGEWDQAMLEYTQALTHNPNDTLAHWGMGKVHQAQGSLGEAQAAFEAALAADPANIIARLDLADLYRDQGKSQQAIDAYRLAIEQQPGYLRSFEALGDFYLAQNKKSKAITQYKQAVPILSNRGQYYLALSDLYRTKGLLEPAATACETVISIDPKSNQAIEAYTKLGAIYQAMGREKDAVNTYRQAITHTPESHSIYERLGSIYLAKASPKKAITLYQEAAIRNSNAAWPHLELGRIYFSRETGD